MRPGISISSLAPLLPLRLFRLGSVAGSDAVGFLFGTSFLTFVLRDRLCYATAAALTGGFQWALWVCGLTGLAAIPVAFVLVRRTRN